jgi:NADPH-dependent ferric siderophore reductase
VKLFFPAAENPAELAMRDFTPRRYDEAAGELWIDFYQHEAGPAATWAAQVAAGQALAVGGPRGSAIISLEGIESHVLIGDETALAAMGRRLEELPAGARALVIVESDGGAKGYPLQSKAALEVVQVLRAAQREAPGQEIGTESQAARAIRRYLTDERGLDRHWIKAAGYWQRGKTGEHDPIQDDR